MEDGYRCMFTCRTCGKSKVPFIVRYRNRGEDIVHYVETAVKPALGIAHAKHSPLCSSMAADLMMPMPDGTEGIGMRILN